VFRPIGVFLFLVILISLADFHRFVNQAGNLPKPDSPKADAIVALTGGSGHRIAASLKLLEQGAGKRLLVSGVHESVDVEALIKTAGGTQALYDCCIDFGRSAHSTEGNAEETAKWVQSHTYESLILVTSNYHMPRSALWFDEALDGVEIIAYPVDSVIRPREWWKSWTSVKGLALEWAKYRVTWLMKVTGK
tara:strand:- start:34245 stop:34820 length:576 start_codon:yes stop_codon:yes gene_type:complete